jgi:hypothetical protein|nr:hypothetical protein [Kofleriaceae bacterium]
MTGPRASGFGPRFGALLLALASCQRHDTSTSADSDDDDRAACDPRTPRQCVANDVVACEPDGKLGRRVRTCKSGCADGACIASCSQDGVQLIYLVDTAEELLSFDPRKLPGDPFKVVGRLACGGRGSPFSMAVDRGGTAWILYGDGQMFAASILDAKCKPTAYRGDITFGMGFVSDSAGSDSETLYTSANDGTFALQTIDKQLRPHTVGTLMGTSGNSPELTGTAGARLFGFYPSDLEPAYVQEIERTTGQPKGVKWPIADSAFPINAYAFAQFGGIFYVFTTSENDSGVTAIDPRTGEHHVVMHHLPFRVTGAGVSTCAPERDGG